MIYFVVFIYLFFCVIIYDVYEKKRYFMFHYVVLFLFFTLIAGLRWRLGVDTINYMNSYTYDMVPLSQLSIEYVLDSNYQPFWVLLNSFCKSFGDFTLLQILVSSFFHFSVFCFFYQFSKKKFTALAIYFLYKYFYFSMEIMRESLSIACFLFGIIYLNKNAILKYYLWVLCAFMFHFFSLFLFIIPFVFVNNISLIKKIFCIISVSFLWLVFKEQILTFFINIVPISIGDKLLKYILSEQFGSNTWRISGFLYNLFSLFVIICFSFLCWRKKIIKVFDLKENIWHGCILLYSIFLILSINMAIVMRFSNYMYIIVVLLYSSCLYAVNFNRISKVVFISICLFFMFGFRISMLMRSERIFDEYKLRIHYYAEFYPYTSVFDKKEPLERKILHTYWGDK